MSDLKPELPNGRSTLEPEPKQRGDTSDSSSSSPSLSPTKIFSQFNFSLDSFLAQNLDEELTDYYYNLRSDLSKTRKELKQQTKKELKQLKHQFDVSMKDAKVVRFMDKVAFTLGMFESCCTPWLVSQYPEWIPSIHTFQSVVLILVRYILYKKKGWHFFLLDMCYFVNATLIMYLYAFPQSKELFTAVWLLSQGPLAFAIITWRNSLVLHSLDKVTSVYIHMSPPITLYVIRWLYPDPDHTTYPALKDMDVLPIGKSLMYAIGLYLAWQIAYYAFVVANREKIEAGKRVTSYTWLLNDPKGGAISRAAHTFGAKYSILTFMGMQLIYTFITCLMGLLVYRNFKLHTAFLVGLFFVSVWNGACYYMEVFSKQYEVQMSKLAAEMISAKNAAEEICAEKLQESQGSSETKKEK